MKAIQLSLLALLLSLMLPAQSFGQAKRLSRAYFEKKYGHFGNPDSTLDHRNYFTAMAAKMGLPDPASMVLEQEVPGESGFTHFKFQQHHHGLPIVGCTYILHEKGGWVRSANGRFTPNPTEGDTPEIAPERALKNAQRAMAAKTFGEPLAAPALCFIDPAYPKVSEKLRLAFKVDVLALDPFDKKRFFVDALTGKVIAQLPLIAEQGVPSTASTKYYGTVGIVTDSIGPQNFVLSDPTRGDGISVTDLNLKKFTSTSSNWNLTNAKMDEVALDAHYCSTRYYDMMLADYGWNGLDGNGKGLKIQVHNNGAGSVNAFWDGDYINFGDGDCLYGPLTTMEVVGHEFTHGVVEFTSQLAYNSESGAINESLADMFGKARAKADPGNFSWKLGHSFALSAGKKPLGSSTTLKSVEMPAFYNGEFWDASNDVHVNSSIGNLWFSMLVDGKQGVNEAGETFDVPKIGMEGASRVAFATNKNYLTASSDYDDFYQTSLLAAEEVFGPGAAEVDAVKEAWKAVGLPATVGGDPLFDLSVSMSGLDWQVSCEAGVYVPITVDVANVGNQPYLPAMGFAVNLSSGNLADSDISLTDPILPGEVFSLVVDDWFLPTDPGDHWVNAGLLPGDDNFNNDFDYGGFTLAEFPENDLELYASAEPAGCFSPDYHLDLVVANRSCLPIPGGTNLPFSVEDGGGAVLWTGSHTLADALPAGEYEYISLTAPLNITAPQTLVAKLNLAADPNLVDNEEPFDAPFTEGITSNYLNQFTDDTELVDRLANKTAIYPSILVDYLGKSYVGSTGFGEIGDDFVTCPDFLDNFDRIWDGVNTLLDACVDFSQIQHSVAAFDMMQFRNSEATASGNQYSSMLQVSWSGSAGGSQVFLGQQEGKLVHHEIDLPPFFKGSVTLKLYTEVGNGELTTDDFPFADVVLLDNLRFKTNTTDIEEAPSVNGLSVSPNPTGGSLEVRSDGPIKTLELTALDGKLLKRQAVDNHRTASLDLDGLGGGVYFLRVEAAGSGEWSVRKVVKMAR